MLDEAKIMRNVNQMCEMDNESSVVNSEWRFQRKCKDKIQECEELKVELEYYKRLYEKALITQDGLEDQLTTSNELHVQRNNSISKLECELHEEGLKIGRLNSKIENQILKEQKLSEMIDKKDQIIHSNRVESESLINSLRSEIETLNEDYNAKEASLDKLLVEKAKMIENLNELNEKCRELTMKELSDKIKETLTVLPAYIRSRATKTVTQNVKKRAMQLDFNDFTILKSVALLIKPQIKLKIVAICVRCVYIKTLILLSLSINFSFFFNFFFPPKEF